MNDKPLGVILREKRQCKKMRTGEVANGICSVTALYAYEIGSRKPKLETLIALAERLGVPVTTLRPDLEYVMVKK